jgi:hypothetical protein
MELGSNERKPIIIIHSRLSFYGSSLTGFCPMPQHRSSGPWNVLQTDLVVVVVGLDWLYRRYEDMLQDWWNMVKL